MKTDEPPPPGLTAFQIQVAQLFFTLPASDGFLLAGGAALLAQHLTARPTQDLDFFTGPGRGHVHIAHHQFIDAAAERGWGVTTVRDEPTFVRLITHGTEDLLVDIALDAAPQRPPTASLLGPTFDPVELAGRKTIALFDRAEARDFADVHALAQRYGRQTLLNQAALLDPGFDRAIFADMLSRLARHTDADLAPICATPTILRQYFADWRDELVRS
jgi:hypothetical protein